MVPLALWFLANSPDQVNPLPALLPDPLTMSADRWMPGPNDPLPQVLNSLHAPASVPGESFLSADILSDLRRDGDNRKKKHRLVADWAAISGELSLRDPDLVRDDPLRRGQAWATDESVRVPLSDTVFVFGSLDAGNDSVEQRQLRYLTKTGVGVKLRPWLLDEVQLRGGPAKRFAESDRTDRNELFVEVTTKLPLPLLGPINVEYSGFAVPAVTHVEGDRLNQNLKFILPMSAGKSEFQFGARWWSTDVPSPTPLVDRTSLFLGLQLRR